MNSAKLEFQLRLNPSKFQFPSLDQVHTTGMDVKHMASACGVLTLGKSLTFRDYAQAAFRLRGLGYGQRIHLFIIPEVKL